MRLVFSPGLEGMVLLGHQATRGGERASRVLFLIYIYSFSLKHLLTPHLGVKAQTANGW